MPEEFQSQWDFGDLFEYARSRKVYTVGELTGKVRRLLEDQFGRVRVFRLERRRGPDCLRDVSGGRGGQPRRLAPSYGGGGDCSRGRSDGL